MTISHITSVCCSSPHVHLPNSLSLTGSQCNCHLPTAGSSHSPISLPTPPLPHLSHWNCLHASHCSVGEVRHHGARYISFRRTSLCGPPLRSSGPDQSGSVYGHREGSRATPNTTAFFIPVSCANMLPYRLKWSCSSELHTTAPPPSVLHTHIHTCLLYF